MKPFAFCVLAVAAALLGCSATPQQRIVGGEDAVAAQIPYQAALSVGGSLNCGAVILSKTYALTSLQCVCSQGSDKPWPPQLFTVRAGSADLYTGMTDIRVAEITVNPNYTDLYNGIAILRLSEAFVFSDKIQAIPLAAAEPPVGATVEVSGWGRIKETELNMYRTLQTNQATVVERTECARTLAKSIDDQALCLGHSRNNGVCRGDFGGPAVYEGQLVGIASYIVGECGSVLPDVFSSIAANYNWIVAQMS